MFLFIRGLSPVCIPSHPYLNTSHVLIYHLPTRTVGGFGRNLNTSHVLIYRWLILSMDSWFPNLNTSHVLIYPEHLAERYKKWEFKYISCSYLSKRIVKRIWLSLLFKYISCSYLSTERQAMDNVIYNLNTSHVLIYLSMTNAHLSCIRI